MRYILVCIIILFSFCQCNKDSHKAALIPKIKSLTIKWNYQSPNHDNIDFYYDNSGRVSSIIGHHGEYEAPIAATDTIFKFLFFYSSINKLPYLSVLVTSYQTYPKGLYEYNYLFYNLQNEVIKDSLVSYDPATSFTSFGIRKYQYTNDYILSDEDTLRMSNGNYVSLSAPPDPNNNRYVWKVTFDNKINPLNSLNISPIYHVVNQSKNPNLSEWSIWSLSNKNNETSDWYGFLPFDNNSIDILTYTYDVNGLPLQRTWQYIPNNVTEDTLQYNYY